MQLPGTEPLLSTARSIAEQGLDVAAMGGEQGHNRVAAATAARKCRRRRRPRHPAAGVPRAT